MPESKERKTDRVLLLKAKEGAKDSKGLVDPRLFTGENNLHVIKNRVGIWSYKYDDGGLPPVLRGKSFTSFDLAHKYAENYFKTRGIEIVGIND